MKRSLAFEDLRSFKVDAIQKNIASRVIFDGNFREGVPDIAGKTLIHCDLSHVNLRGVDIRGTTFSGCTLYNTNFDGAIYDTKTRVLYAGQKRPWVNNRNGRGAAWFNQDQLKQFFEVEKKVRFR